MASETSTAGSTTAKPLSFLERNLPFSLEVVIGIVVGCVFVVFVLCAGIAGVCCYRNKRSKQSATNLQRGRPSKNNDYLTQKVPSHIGTDGHVEKAKKKLLNAGKLSLDVKDVIGSVMSKQMEKYIIESERLTLGEILGSGEFGLVYKATLLDKKRETSIDVAVKTMQGEECTKKEMQAFLEEVILMRAFNHKNVLSMMGLSIVNEKPYAVLPFMEKGDLKSYLQDPEKNFIVLDLMNMCAQIAEGMNYLSQQGFVHRDLAARNCMVSKDDEIKIADFGLSRDMFNDAYYRMENQNTPLPVRWMAVESLETKVFTQKTDVWSFGVVMWEVLSRGKNPYPERDNLNVVKYVKTGGRLSKPDYVNDEVYTIMYNCWKKDPNNRPTFHELSETLHSILKRANKPSYMNVTETTNTPKKKGK